MSTDNQQTSSNGASEKLTKPYDPTTTEGRIYETWEKSGFFNPDNLPERHKDPFTIVLPPPNVTGILHIGHAYEDTVQDIATRYHRMQGKKALWIPGTDSAAIATQARVEKNIQKEENKTRHDLGREELVRRVSEYAKNSESTILSQVKRVGASLDWSRYAYTLDDKRNKAVFTAFKSMYDAGLIYQGNRIVNWDPKGQTTISDDEIVYEERKAILYTFKYSKDFPISISTTRPETKVGDTALAVNPDDERYKKYIDQEYEAVFCDVPIKIKIVADKSVDPEFGTGALGVTPAHSMIDWEIADRHNLERPQVINEYAKMMVNGRLDGLKTTEARSVVVEWLKEQNLLEKEEEVDQNVATAERTGAIIEPLPKLQWWIAVDREFIIEKSAIPGITAGSKTTLKEIMRKSVESGAVDMPQENFRKTYFNWLDNLHDW
ncbi:MAG: valyl-tRNA synthetase, partial [Patescibacteria group bacterium]|nr:valyl-tRNA synthetase [Patescibacteria group bacterium]